MFSGWFRDLPLLTKLMQRNEATCSGATENSVSWEFKAVSFFPDGPATSAQEKKKKGWAIEAIPAFYASVFTNPTDKPSIDAAVANDPMHLYGCVPTGPQNEVQTSFCWHEMYHHLCHHVLKRKWRRNCFFPGALVTCF
jgi:hypothetical protein